MTKVKFCYAHPCRECNDNCVAFSMWGNGYNCKALKNSIDFEPVRDNAEVKHVVIGGTRN